MHQEDIERARNLISQTTILSSVEKAEWAQLLPQMNDKQILELIKILAPIPAAAQGSAAVTISQQPKVDIKQKEIAAPGALRSSPQTSVQPKPAVPNLPNITPRPTTISNESLPRPRPVSSAAQGPAPEPLYSRPSTVPAAAPAQSAAKVSQQRPTIPTIPSIQRPVQNKPESQESFAQSATVAEPLAQQTQQPVKIVFKSPDEFLSLNPTMLHGKDPYPLLQAILNSIVEFSKKQKFLPVIYNIERSPLQKAYVDFGMRLLNDPSADREEVYNRVISEAKARGQDILTKEEFEAFTDFRKELNKLLVI